MDLREHYRQCLRDIASIPVGPDGKSELSPALYALADRYQARLRSLDDPTISVGPFGLPGLTAATGPVSYLCHWYFERPGPYRRSRDAISSGAGSRRVAAAPALLISGPEKVIHNLGRVTSVTRQKSEIRTPASESPVLRGSLGARDRRRLVTRS